MRVLPILLTLTIGMILGFTIGLEAMVAWTKLNTPPITHMEYNR